MSFPKPQQDFIIRAEAVGAGGKIMAGPIVERNPDLLLFTITSDGKTARVVLRRRQAIEFGLKLLEGVFEERDRKVIRALIERLLG